MFKRHLAKGEQIAFGTGWLRRVAPLACAALASIASTSASSQETSVVRNGEAGFPSGFNLIVWKEGDLARAVSFSAYQLPDARGEGFPVGNIRGGYLSENGSVSIDEIEFDGQELIGRADISEDIEVIGIHSTAIVEFRKNPPP